MEVRPVDNVTPIAESLFLGATICLAGFVASKVFCDNYLKYGRWGIPISITAAYASWRFRPMEERAPVHNVAITTLRHEPPAPPLKPAAPGAARGDTPQRQPPPPQSRQQGAAQFIPAIRASLEAITVAATPIEPPPPLPLTFDALAALDLEERSFRANLENSILGELWSFEGTLILTTLQIEQFVKEMRVRGEPPRAKYISLSSSPILTKEELASIALLRNALPTPLVFEDVWKLSLPDLVTLLKATNEIFFPQVGVLGYSACNWKDEREVIGRIEYVCPNLIGLDLGNCNRITEEVSELITLLPMVYRLELIGVRQPPKRGEPPRERGAFTIPTLPGRDQTVLKMIEQLSLLERPLILEEFSQIPLALSPHVRWLRFPKVRKLILSDEARILRDSDVADIVTACPNLVSLNLQKCRNLTQAMLFSLMRLPYLKELKLPEESFSVDSTSDLPRPEDPVLVRLFYSQEFIAGNEQKISQLQGRIPFVFAPIFQIPAALMGLTEDLFSPHQTSLDSFSIHLWLTSKEAFDSLPLLRKIERIDADYNLLLNDQNIDEFLRKFPKVQRISLRHCLNISPEKRAELQVRGIITEDRIERTLDGRTEEVDFVEEEIAKNLRCGEWVGERAANELIRLYKVCQPQEGNEQTTAQDLTQFYALKLLEQTIDEKSVASIRVFAEEEKLASLYQACDLFLATFPPENAESQTAACAENRAPLEPRFNPLDEKYSDLSLQLIDQERTLKLQKRVLATACPKMRRLFELGKAWVGPTGAIGFYPPSDRSAFVNSDPLTTPLHKRTPLQRVFFEQFNGSPPEDRASREAFAEQFADKDITSSEPIRWLIEAIYHPGEAQTLIGLLNAEETRELEAATSSFEIEWIARQTQDHLIELELKDYPGSTLAWAAANAKSEMQEKIVEKLNRCPTILRDCAEEERGILFFQLMEIVSQGDFDTPLEWCPLLHEVKALANTLYDRYDGFYNDLPREQGAIFYRMTETFAVSDPDNISRVAAEDRLATLLARAIEETPSHKENFTQPTFNDNQSGIGGTIDWQTIVTFLQYNPDLNPDGPFWG